MRLVYYALGGGLGHLVRARAFLHTLGLAQDAVLITASPHARDARVTGDLEILAAPQSLEHDAVAFRAWLVRELERLAADCLCVDVFPAGILGELCDFPTGLVGSWWHVARLLRWNEYATLIGGAAPRYERVFRVEKLADAQQQFLDQHSDRCEDLHLIDSAPVAACVEAQPYWLVVHSGPAQEVADLIAYAEEVRAMEGVEVPLLVATLDAPARLPAGAHLLDVYPAAAYFAAAQRIFSAAGFNVMRQTTLFRDKQMLLPMPRRFDDQFERARRSAAAHGNVTGKAGAPVRSA